MGISQINNNVKGLINVSSNHYSTLWGMHLIIYIEYIDIKCPKYN